LNKVPQNAGYLCHFHVTAQSKPITYWAIFHPIWSPCLSPATLLTATNRNRLAVEIKWMMQAQKMRTRNGNDPVVDFYPKTNVSTRVEKFLLRLKSFYTGSTQVVMFLPRLKSFFPG
jgi:L-asparagine transporter-like permease